MNDDHVLILIAGMAAAFIGGYFWGRLSMLGTIVKAVAEEAEKELEQTQTPNILTVEQHNDVYYAYVDGNFAAQGSTFFDLFTAVKLNKNYDVVNINKSTAEALKLDVKGAKEMAEAVAKVYGKKDEK